MLAESSELESHALSDALRLANECEPCPLYSPCWSPARDLRSGLPLTRRLHRLSMLAGRVGGSRRNRTCITPLKRRVSVSLS